MNKLIAGCGYLGLRVARRWLAGGHSVHALTRSPDRAEELQREGITPITADVTRPESLARLPVADTVLWSVGWDPQGGADRRAVYVAGLRAVLDALPPATRRIVMTSSTGVYGQADGRWIDEDSPCRPVREAGRVMLEAEETLRSHPLGDRAIVLRLAGLYGPGRIPRMRQLAAGEPIVASPGGHLNLIHVDDAAAAVLAAESRATPPRTYLVSDGHPTQQRDFYAQLAGLLGVGPPQFAEPDADTQRAQRGGNKRVRNGRMLDELGVELQHPTYREGLAAIVAAAR